MNVKESVTIVTGSSRGIGAAAVKMLAAQGGRVVINYTSSEADAKDVAAACEAAGGEALLCQANIGSDEDCRRLVQSAVERWGRLDGLINNAGTTKFVNHADLDGLDAADFQAIMGINVVGMFQMTRAAAPAMRESGGGSVVNISSIAGVMGVGSSIAYAASKGAVNTMTLSLARVLGPEIRVNCVCPGFVEGSWLREGMGAERYEATKAHLQKTNALRRTGSPDDMAEAAVMMLTIGRHITGEILMCDGGMHLGGAPIVAR